MSKAILDIHYEYNWNPLVGCLQSLLRAEGLPHDAARVSAVSGEAFRVVVPPLSVDGVAFLGGVVVPRDFARLAADLALLGLRARVDVWDLRSGRPLLLGRRVGRGLRRALGAGHAVAAYGSVGNGFGLLVGFDKERRAYRVRGPLTEETGGWLSVDRLPAADADWLALVVAEGVAAGGVASVDRLARRAGEHCAEARADEALREWMAVLRSDVEIDAPGHAQSAQALAAAAGEASRFWRGCAEGGVAWVAPVVEPAAQLALAYSRFATLFPYPAGGDVLGGGREAGARALASAGGVAGEVAERARELPGAAR
ncbi:MAG: hypothetical protein DK306_000754 [Chloroflexi bacterium]|nr:MAG: hypothetical protein DK306_000754 [Chloroflexota bacterium]